MLFEIFKRHEAVRVLAVYDEGRKGIGYFRDGDEGLQGAEVEIVVERIHAQTWIGFVQIGERIARFIAITAVAGIAVEIEDSDGRLRSTGGCKLFIDELVTDFKQGVLILQSCYLRIIAPKLAFSIGKASAEIREFARECSRGADAVARCCSKEGKLRIEREDINRELISDSRQFSHTRPIQIINGIGDCSRKHDGDAESYKRISSGK